LDRGIAGKEVLTTDHILRMREKAGALLVPHAKHGVLAILPTVVAGNQATCSCWKMIASPENLRWEDVRTKMRLRI